MKRRSFIQSILALFGAATLGTSARGNANESGPATLQPPRQAEWWAVMHSCGGAAFVYHRWPAYGEMVQASRARHVDGRRISAGERMTCDHCGITVGVPPRSALKPLSDDFIPGDITIGIDDYALLYGMKA